MKYVQGILHHKDLLFREKDLKGVEGISATTVPLVFLCHLAAAGGAKKPLFV